MSAVPRVSVCVPTWNGARWVGEAVRSALAQSVADLEVVVSDDGSTDGTLDVVAAHRDARVRVLDRQAADHAEPPASSSARRSSARSSR